MMSEITLYSEEIQWSDKPMTWQEAIAFSAGPLLDAGKVEPSYIEAMIQNIHDLGPYILIAPHVALPHARPEAGVNEAGVSVAVLQQGAAFPEAGHTGDNEAQIFICLAAVDSESHLHLLRTISTWIEDSQVIEKLRRAGSADEVRTILFDVQKQKGDDEK
ncbi:PTS sugar transporter subunit IIA [Alkalicoccus urumqiensis]|uniref:Ascorbate-specific PTS system EIIA component n=1 Tax=Alkalicoccus urumqiensis TaxID=1548213 RepID=A0A2P6MLC4_ALKUR|nr:PTS sugar transporter subunit IIA [Alkalicoccus urumqiensis]PRO67081.1 hypothetical protein C6I21_00495 [Alkalicoccus urumqiensis]